MSLSRWYTDESVKRIFFLDVTAGTLYELDKIFLQAVKDVEESFSAPSIVALTEVYVSYYARRPHMAVTLLQRD